jgi:hypothetical protein
MRKLVNILLAAAFVGCLVGCLVWAAVAPRMQALIPTILGIVTAEILLSRKTGYIRYY